MKKYFSLYMSSPLALLLTAILVPSVYFFYFFHEFSKGETDRIFSWSDDTLGLLGIASVTISMWFYFRFIEHDPHTVQEIFDQVRQLESELILAKRERDKRGLLALFGGLGVVACIFALQFFFVGGFSPFYTVIFTIPVWLVSANEYMSRLKEVVANYESEISYFRYISLDYNKEILKWCNRVPEIRSFADKVASLGRGFTYREYRSMSRYAEDYDQILAGREVFRNRESAQETTVVSEPSASSDTSANVRKVNIN